MEQNRLQRQTQKYLVIWFEVNMPKNEVWNNVYPVNCVVPIRYPYERYKKKNVTPFTWYRNEFYLDL